jgi:hypothetical protein
MSRPDFTIAKPHRFVVSTPCRHRNDNFELEMLLANFDVFSRKRIQAGSMVAQVGV